MSDTQDHSASPSPSQQQQPGYAPRPAAPYPPYPAPPYPYAQPQQQQQGSGWLSKLFTRFMVTVLIISLLMNFYLAAIVASMVNGPTEDIYAEGDPAYRIVIVPVNGMIAQEMHGFVRDAFDRMRKDPPAAIVLRVDSPGGTVSASDQIWHTITTFQGDMDAAGTPVPIIASYGMIAASGGVYISAPCDQIIAEPTTITGSIGVIAQAFTMHKLLDKVGVTPEVIVATGSPEKDVLDAFNEWDEKDRDTLRKVLDSSYDRFVDVVHQGRQHMPKLATVDAVKQVATGMVYTAQEAKDLELIDDIGYLDAAIDAAKQAASLPAGVDPQVTIATRQLTFMEMLAGVSGPEQAGGVTLNSLDAKAVRQWMSEVGTPRLEYRWSPTGW